MPFQLKDDRAALYPKIMAARAVPGYERDDRIVNELSGFIGRLYDSDAAFTVDHVIDMGTVEVIGNPKRFRKLVELAVRLDLLEETVDVRGLNAVALVTDENYISVRTADEISWRDRQRDDTRNPGLAGPVRRRDGDNCRYCGVPVAWTGKKSPRSGTLDHWRPKEPGSFETLVVACTKCNSGLRDLAGEQREQLQQPPAAPRYGVVTAKYLAENGYLTLTREISAYLDDNSIKTRYLTNQDGQLVCGPAPTGERGDVDSTTGLRPATAGTATGSTTGQRPSDIPGEIFTGDVTPGTATGVSGPTPSGNAAEPNPPELSSQPVRTEFVGQGRGGEGTAVRSSPNPAGTGTSPPAGTGPPPQQPRAKARARSRRARPPQQEGTP